MRFSKLFGHLFSMLLVIIAWNKPYNTQHTNHNDTWHTIHTHTNKDIPDDMRRQGELPSWGRERVNPLPLRKRVCGIVKLEI